MQIADLTAIAKAAAEIQAEPIQAVAKTHGVCISHVEPLKLSKRIGSTVYEARLYFNQDAKETVDEKILRIIKNEVKYGNAAG